MDVMKNAAVRARRKWRDVVIDSRSVVFRARRENVNSCQDERDGWRFEASLSF